MNRWLTPAVLLAILRDGQRRARTPSDAEAWMRVVLAALQIATVHRLGPVGFVIPLAIIITEAGGGYQPQQRSITGLTGTCSHAALERFWPGARCAASGEHRTWEEIDGREIPMVRGFRQYPDELSAVADLIRLLTQAPHYASWRWWAQGPGEGVASVWCGGYATSTAWPSTVMGVLRSWGVPVSAAALRWAVEVRETRQRLCPGR